MTSWMNPDGVIIICIQNVSLAHLERKASHEFPSHLFCLLSFPLASCRLSPFSVFRLSAFPPFVLHFHFFTFPPSHLSPFSPFLAFPFDLYMSKTIDILPALSLNSLPFILTAPKKSERDGCPLPPSSLSAQFPKSPNSFLLPRLP